MLADATAKLDHIWSTKLENHVRVLTGRWEQVWHQIDLSHQILEITGRLPQRAVAVAAEAPMLYHSVEGVDLSKALGLTTSPRPAVEPTPATSPVDLGSEDTETMREPWRANPPSQSEPEPEPSIAVEKPAVPATPVLPDSVTRAARALAQQVWSAGSKPRAHLLAGQNPTAQAETERALNCAVDSNWIAVSGDQIVKGSVSPNPMEALPDERQPRGMWSPMFR